MPTIKIGTVQMECKPGDWKCNLDTAVRLIEKGRAGGAGIVLLPELFNTGFLMDQDLARVAGEAYDTTVTALSGLADGLGLTIVAGIPVPRENKPLNGAMLFKPGGIIKTGGKLHLCRTGSDEAKYSCAADELLSFELEEARIGTLVCYDVAFPEAARILVLEGANIIFVLTAWNLSERSYVYELSTLSRALENGVWLVSSNQTGGTADNLFLGASRFVTPRGLVLAEMKREQGVLVKEIDPGYSEKLLARGETYPFLKDRLPEKYGRLCER